MASNKNQHFVPRCYLREFTIQAENKAINLFNVDRKKFIEGAPVKNQCSGDYFYGRDRQIETALQSTEGTYSSTLREILEPGYFLKDEHRTFLKRFWLLQHMRTEAASRRSVEMTEQMGKAVGDDPQQFRMGIDEAVQESMHAFVQEMHVVDDLKICLLRNKSNSPFITSDDPAILTNKWYLLDKRTVGNSFGLGSSGALLFLPLSPNIFCIGYDGDVYSIPHENGWVNVHKDRDVDALNQHQLLNCRANVFIRSNEHQNIVRDLYDLIEESRPESRCRVQYAVLDHVGPNEKRYRVVDRAAAPDHTEAMIHYQPVHPVPTSWPHLIKWKRKGFVSTNGSGIGYIRTSMMDRHSGAFTKEPIRR
nr:DUF4238 domain-containing protein [uncultured Marinobacter sp.]